MNRPNIDVLYIEIVYKEAYVETATVGQGDVKCYMHMNTGIGYIK